MSKETILTTPGRVLASRTVINSNWQVDEAIQIPVREGQVPIPLWSSPIQKRANCRGSSFKRRFAAMAALLMCVVAGISAKAAQNVSIAWNASTDPTTAGYVVFAGATTNYTAQLNVGTNTMVTLTGLKEGTTNYFAVSAYNSANMLSSPSTAISYIVPGRLVMTSASSTATLLQFPTALGHWYEVDTSKDLTNWTSLYQTAKATTNAWTNFTDTHPGPTRQRFYRLVMH